MHSDDNQLTSTLLDMPIDRLFGRAEDLTLDRFGPVVSWSPKVFLPTTMLCRNVCHYCTFAKAPRSLPAPYMAIPEMLAIADQGRAAGCREALFTLGDRPELRYMVARNWLSDNGYASTLHYVREAAGRVFEETGLLPHLNPGVMDASELADLRPVAASMGLMLETITERLGARGGPHFGSPDKLPAVRLATMDAAGQLAIPFTTGILIGLGETRAERIAALLAIRDLHRKHGHIQEIIVQNFRAKAGTRMAGHAEPDLDDHCWTIAVARLIVGGDIAIQAPPNLRAGALAPLLRAGVNDWGGVSPVTRDHVNPEAAWPTLDVLRAETEQAGRTLMPRLAIGPRHAVDADRWTVPALATAIRRQVDTAGFAREDDWNAGLSTEVPTMRAVGVLTAGFMQALDAARSDRAGRTEIVRLFEARGAEARALTEAADTARRETVGDTVSYVTNRNINYANICTYSCGFCAFSKSRAGGGFRDTPYVLDTTEIAERAVEAWNMGASEVCLQGGIHPRFDGHTYLAIVRAVHEAVPDLHIHAFSPLEVAHGADTLGLSLETYLGRLAEAGLRSLPGTAAEILDDGVRCRLTADKISVDRWADVMRAAHRVGLSSTATIMFGHVESYDDWATHLLRLRALQAETGGFTEFVPLPFVHERTPIWVRGHARNGPTFQEAVSMHAVARLVLGPTFRNIQTSWTKMGVAGAIACLQAGANDLGGTLMNESITRAAGGRHGQQMTTDGLIGLAESAGRRAHRRRTDYVLYPTNCETTA